MDLISVIVPVYKVEAYLDRCVQSIVDQTYTNLEIILVDDGSPDRCPEMCDEWAKKDSRIRVIHKKNGGLSDARNIGTKAATGSLIGFIDSDDWIEKNMYELLYCHLVDNDADISACGIEMFWEDNSKSPTMLSAPGKVLLDTREALTAILNETSLKQPVWYKLYKKELVADLFFPVGKYHEDAFWTYLAISRAKKISVFDTPCYHYAQRSSSIMGESYSLRRLDGLEAKLQQLSFFETNYSDLRFIAQKNLLFSSIYAMQMILRYMSGPDKKEAIRKVSTIFKTHTTHLPTGISVKQKLWLYLGKISLRVTARVRNILKIGC